MKKRVKAVWATIAALFAMNATTVFAESAGTADAGAAAGVGGGSFLIIILVFVALYGWMFWSERKRKKGVQSMLDSMAAGDEAVTIGGITGKILNVKDETVTLEVGANRTNLEFQKWAIKTVTKPE